MGFADAIQRFQKNTTVALDRHVSLVEAIGLERLAKELAERLPERTPVDRGQLKAAYRFEITDNQLTVGNDQFYAVAIQRQGAQYDLHEIILEEAEKIVNDQGFLRAVGHAAYLRARVT